MRQLLGVLRRMQQSLVETVIVVRANVLGVVSASAQIAVGNHDLSGRTEEQVSALEEMAAATSSLNNQAQSLMQAVAVFKLSDL